MTTRSPKLEAAIEAAVMQLPVWIRPKARAVLNDLVDAILAEAVSQMADEQ